MELYTTSLPKLILVPLTVPTTAVPYALFPVSAKAITTLLFVESNTAARAWASPAAYTDEIPTDWVAPDTAFTVPSLWMITVCPLDNDPDATNETVRLVPVKALPSPVNEVAVTTPVAWSPESLIVVIPATVIGELKVLIPVTSNPFAETWIPSRAVMIPVEFILSASWYVNVPSTDALPDKVTSPPPKSPENVPVVEVAPWVKSGAEVPVLSVSVSALSLDTYFTTFFSIYIMIRHELQCKYNCLHYRLQHPENLQV